MDRREFLGSSLGATAVVPNLLLPAFLSPESISRNIPDDYAAARFRNAREFMGGLEAHALQDHESFLYSAGIVTQLGLTAYLFGKGLTDDWCRERIGLDVEKALAFANHLGLGCNCPRIAVLVQLLGNYGQWRKPSVADLPDVSSLRPREVSADVATLIDQVQRELWS